MPSFNFSENTIALDDWNQLDDTGKRNQAAASILVVASHSGIENLGSDLNKFERIIITSTDFNDGRIFSIGRQFRLLGFPGRLTAVGDILPDQYFPLKSCGFDDVISLDSDAINGIVELDHSSSLVTVGNQLNGDSESRFSVGNNQ